MRKKLLAADNTVLEFLTLAFDNLSRDIRRHFKYVLPVTEQVAHNVPTRVFKKLSVRNEASFHQMVKISQISFFIDKNLNATKIFEIRKLLILRFFDEFFQLREKKVLFKRVCAICRYLL